MFDIHAHVLPGIDDGPRSIDESLELLNAYVADGVTHVVATPHIYPGVFDNSWSGIAASFNTLIDRVDAQGIPLNLSFAAEVRLCPEMLDWMRDGDLPVFSGEDGVSVYALVELPDGVVPVGAEAVLSQMVREGVTPIIAHPERNRAIMETPAKAAALVRLGCLLQVTSASLLGEFGDRARVTAQTLMDSGLVSLVASDAHNLRSRKPRMSAARAWLAQTYGEEAALRLTTTAPRTIAGKSLNSVGSAKGVKLREMPRRFRPRHKAPTNAGTAPFSLRDLPQQGQPSAGVVSNGLLDELKNAPRRPASQAGAAPKSDPGSLKWALPALKEWGPETPAQPQTAATEHPAEAPAFRPTDFADTMPFFQSDRRTSGDALQEAERALPTAPTQTVVSTSATARAFAEPRVNDAPSASIPLGQPQEPVWPDTHIAHVPEEPDAAVATVVSAEPAVNAGQVAPAVAVTPESAHAPADVGADEPVERPEAVQGLTEALAAFNEPRQTASTPAGEEQSAVSTLPVLQTRVAAQAAPVAPPAEVISFKDDVPTLPRPWFRRFVDVLLGRLMHSARRFKSAPREAQVSLLEMSPIPSTVPVAAAVPVPVSGLDDPRDADVIDPPSSAEPVRGRTLSDFDPVPQRPPYAQG